MRNETDYKGIDYGLGQTNRDFAADIRYGVINQNEVSEAWFEVSESHYDYICLICGTNIEEPFLDDECPDCGHEFDHDEWDMVEPVSFFYDKEGYKMTQSGDDTDIFVIKSPFYTYAQHCSPCAPGAGSLMNPLNEKVAGNKTYCLGHNWFEAKAKGMKTCELCDRGLRLKRDIPNFKEETFIANGGKVIGAFAVECWACNGMGTVNNYVSKAPYKVYDVKTNRRVFQEE